MLLSLFIAAASAITAPASADSIRSRQLGEAVITGTNHPVNQRTLPYTVSVVERKQLELTGNSQLLSAISGTIPSLFVSERSMLGFGVSNGGSGGIKIRGVGGSPTNAVLMMIDGQPQFSGVYSHPVADVYGTENVERVEVLRGPASVLYGSNAMGGVINVITRQAHHDGTQSTLSSQFGSHNTWNSAFSTTSRYGRFSSTAAVSFDRTDGTQKNFDFRQWNGYAKVGYDFSAHWKAAADVSVMNFRGNDPIYATLSNAESTDVYHQNITRGETSLAVTNHYGATTGTIRTYYSWGNHYIRDPRAFHALDDRFGILAYESFRPWKAAHATIGFDFNTYSGRIPMSGGNAVSTGAMGTLERRTITEYSPYVTLAQSFFNNVFTLNAGLRVASSDKFSTQWVPQAGFSVHATPQLTFKGSVAKGYRNPSFRELYLYRTANAELNPERMMNYELTAAYDFTPRIHAELTAYLADGSNMIQTVEMKNVNTGTFVNRGLEFSVNARVLDNLDLRGTYSHLDASKHLDAAPRTQYSLGATWLPSEKWTVSADLRGVGRLYVTDSRLDAGHFTQSYAVLNARVGFRPLRCLELFVLGDNLTDARYTILRGYEMPGITAQGGFKLTF